MKMAPKVFVFRLILTGLAAALAPAKSAQAQNLFVSNGGNGTITEITPDGVESEFATGLAEPNGLAFDNQENLYVATGVAVYQYPSAGGRNTFINSSALALAVDASGNLYTASSRFAYEYTPAGTETGLLEYQSGIISMAFNAGGDLFTSNYLPGSGTIMERIPGQGSTVFASGLDQPAGLAFNGMGDLFVADYGTGGIDEYTPDGTQSIFATGLDQPYGLAFNSSGDLFAADAGDGDITEIAPDGTQSIFATGLDEPFELAFQGQALPIPEPSSVAIFVFGAVTLAVVSSRRRQVTATNPLRPSAICA